MSVLANLHTFDRLHDSYKMIRVLGHVQSEFGNCVFSCLLSLTFLNTETIKCIVSGKPLRVTTT